MNLSQLPIARYRFTLRVTKAFTIHQYPGSALRGIFGHALRDLSCVTKAKQCHGCPLIEQCPYITIFEPHCLPKKNSPFTTLQQIPVPYIIEGPLEKRKTYDEEELFVFEMVLMGQAISQLPLIILAWRRAFLKGITHDRGTASIETVELVTQFGDAVEIYSGISPVIQKHTADISVPSKFQVQDCTLKFHTPLRIEKNKRSLGPYDLTPSIFLRHLLRRISLLLAYHLIDNEQNTLNTDDIKKLNLQADKINDKKEIYWQNWSRYSSRQKQKMNLGGVTGQWQLNECPVEWLPFLYLGQWLHAGKETAFGLGKYTISEFSQSSVGKSTSITPA